MFYTNRRANVEGLSGVTWVHGTKIGIAESRDEGASWTYVGTADIELPAATQFDLDNTPEGKIRCFYTSGVYIRIGVAIHCHVLSCVHDDLGRGGRPGNWRSRR